MKQKLLLKSLVLLFALIAGSMNVWADDILNETFTDGLPSGWTSDATGGGSTTGASTSDSNGRTDSKCWKLGTNSNPYGSITTSELTIPENAVLTFWTKAKSGKTPELLVTGTNCTLTGDYNATAANNNTYKKFTVNITNVTGKVTLTFKHNSPSSGSYIYLDDIVITPPPHTLTYSATNGSIAGEDAGSNAVASGASVAEGATVTLTATPASGYAFSSWSVSGTGATLSSTTTNPTTFTMGTADATVTANFEVVAGDYITPSPTSVNIVCDGDVAEFEMSTNISTPSYALAFYTSSTGDETTTKPTWLGDYEFNGNTLDIEVGENTTASERSAYFKVYSGSTYSSVITITQDALVVAAPTFSPAAGAVDAGSNVILTQASADEIRYTTDGTDPTKTTGTVYSGPIEITTATTIKAIAVKGDVVSDVATAAYTISVAAPTFSLNGGSYLEGTTITITSAGNTIYYTTTTDGTEPAVPTTGSTEYTAPIALPSGSFRIKAIAYDTYGNASSTTQRTYTGIAPASLPFSWTGTSSAGKADLEEKTGVVVNLSSDYASSNAPYRLKFDGTSKYVIIYTNEKPETVYFTAKIFNAASTGSKIKVQGSADGITFTDIEEFTIKGAANATFEFTTSNAFAATHRAVKLMMSSKDQNVAVGTITVAPATVPATINSTYEWATFSSTIPLDFTGTGVSAYIVTGFEGTAVTKTQVNKVPANTGLLLNGTTDNIPLATGDLDDVSANKMVAVTTATTISKVDGKTRYVLADEGGKAMFLSINATAANIPAGKAYLEITGDGARELYFDDTTAINALENATKIDNGAIYDLSGRRVENPTKGIYIMNGKKVIFK